MNSRQSILRDARTARVRRKHGWFSINFVTDAYLRVHQSTALEVAQIGITDAAGNGLQWNPGVLTAPFVYKEFFASTTFDVETSISSITNDLGTISGILCQVEDSAGVGLDDWIYWARTFLSDQDESSVLRVDSSVGGVLTESTAFYIYSDSRIRMVRSGDTFDLYSTDVVDPDLSDWALRATRTVSLGGRTRVGFFVSHIGSAVIAQAEYDHWHVRAGGLPSCSFNLEGSNGCRDHGNIRNFFAFPATRRR